MSDKRRRQRRMIIEPLEPRLLFSATTDALLLDDFGTDAADLQDDAASTDLTQVYALQDPFDDLEKTESAAAETNEPSEQVTEQRQPLREIIFIDTAVDDYQLLLQGIQANNPDAEVVLLDSDTNGINQITDTLSDYTGVAAIHLISHGSAGALQLGNAVLNPDAIANYSDELISWREALGENADILLYGCDLASTQAGVDLVNQIALYTGADIAASNDDTGNQSLGGDWEFEYQHGAIEMDLAVDNSTQETWLGLLADTNHINTGDGLHNLPVSSANHMGQSFTYTSGDGTYAVNEISIQLARYASAQPQTVTLELRDAWSGDILGSASVSSAAISDTGFEWHSFSFADVELNDGQTYYIRISTDAADDEILIRHFDSNQHSGGAYIQNGTAEASGWDLAFKISEEDGSNTAPTVNNPLVDQAANEDTPFSYTVPSNTFSEPDPNDTFSYRAQLAGGGNLDWLVFNEITREFTGTPRNNHVGTWTVEVIATDNHGASTSDFFDIVVNNTNDDPYVNVGLGDQAVTEDNAFSYTVPTDAFGDDDSSASLTYSAQLSGGGALPAWLTFDTGTNTFSGTPTSADVGTVSVEVTADDGQGGMLATDTFDIVVSAAASSGAQIHESTGAATDGIGVTASQLVAQTFTDHDGVGTYQVDAVAVQLRYSSGALDQTPQTITVSLLDDFNGTVLGSDTMSSAELTTTLEWYSFNFGAASLTYGQQYYIKVEASAGSGDPLVYAGIHSTSVYSDGTYVANNGIADAGRDLAFEISSGTNNYPIVANPIPDQSTPEETTYIYEIPSTIFSDLDGDTLTLSAELANGDPLPGWLNFNAVTNELWGTPDDGNVGTLDIRIIASDGNGGTASDTFNLTITNVNDDPHIALGLADQNAEDNSFFSYTFPANTFGDGDVDSLTYTAELSGGGALPAWLSFDSTSRTFSGTPATSDVSTISIDVTADDGNGGTVTDTFTLTVTDTNDAPIITSNGGGTAAYLSAAENQTAVTTVTSSDFDSDVPAFSIVGGADAALFSIDSNTGIVTFNSAQDFESAADADTDNVYHVQVRASDGSLTDDQMLNITVTNVNEAPVITSNGGSAAASVNAAENQTAVTTIVATDVDGDTPIFSISGGADSALFSIEASTGALTFASTPDFESATDADTNGVYEVEVTASDGNGGTDIQTLSVTVTDVNEAPVITSNGGAATASVNAAENQAAVTTVVATDIDGDTPTFSISGGADSALFSIDTSTGALTFISAPDFESATDADTNGVYEVEVTASDGNGGTDVQAISVTITNVNEAPVITSNGGSTTASLNAAENQTAVTTVVATDIDGDTPTFSISGGADSALFSIDTSTGALTFASAPNFESATDADTNGVYEVEVTASDGNGGTDIQTLSVTVTDVNEAPVITSNGGAATASVNAAENQAAVTTVVATDIDGDTPTFSISGGADSALFSIDASTGALTFASAPNFESATDADTNGVYEVEVTASDGNGGIDVQTITVTVTDINEAPMITSSGGGASASINAAENQTAVVTVTATDADGDASAFSISGGSDSALFSIDVNTGALTFTSAPNFENQVDTNADGVYEVEVTASDGNGGTDIQTISVTVTDVNEAPVITSNGGAATASVNAAENQTSVTTVVATDVDGDTPTFSISGGADSALFNIDASTGALTFASTPDFESSTDSGTDGVYEVEVTASDGSGGTDIQTISVTVTNVNEAPTITSNSGGTTAAISAAENQSAVTTVTASDVDGDTPTFSISGGADSALFSIDTSTGALTFASAPDFESTTDANTDGVYEVEITASDGNGGTDIQTLSVTVTNMNEAPVITSNGGAAAASVNAAENQTVVTTVTASDADGDTPTFGVTGGADAALFSIDTSTGALTFTSAPDFENATDADTDGVYEVEVTASDGNGGTDIQTISVTVTNVNESPVITSNGGSTTASVNAAENQAAVTTVVATDIDGDTPTFSISGGADSALFSIDASTGALTFASAPNFESATDSDTDGVYEVEVTASDGNGSTDIQTLSVTVTNVNEAPVITSNGGAAAASVNAAENQSAVTTVTASDVDGDTPTFSISGGADSALFSIDTSTGALTFISAPDFESATDADTNGVYEVEVTASDGNGGTDVQAISVTITNGNEAPVITSNGGAATASVNAAENQTSVTTVVATDVDGDTPTFSISGGADSALFSIDTSTGALTFASAPNFESATDSDTDGVYEVEVTASDGNGGTDIQTISVTVTNVNEAPVITSNGSAAATSVNAAENQAAVTTVVATDIDGDTPTFSISGGEDSALFNIDASTGALTFTSAPDFESSTDSGTDGVYEVEVTANDGNGGSDIQTLSVTVTNVNEAPVITSNGGAAAASVNAAENQAAVTTVVATDIDGDTPTFSISGGADSALFSIDTSTGALTFASAPDFESTTDANTDGVYEVEITASDGNGGSDIQTISVTVTNVNEAPTITSNSGGATAAINSAENQATITTVTASDGDGDALTFGVNGGADAALFSINARTGELTFITPQDSENPSDTDANGIYEVDVITNDGNGGTDIQTLSVTVTDANDAPVITSNGGGSTAAANAAENQTAAVTVTASDADGDTPTFSITGGTDSASFTINASTGELRFVSTPNFEAASDADSDGIYDVEITASDGNGGTDIQALSITVTDSNDNPIATSALPDQIATEDAPFNFQFAANTFDDADTADTLTYSAQLSNGDPMPTWLDFYIATRTFSGTPTNGDVGSLSVVVTATDTSGANATDTFTITITNTNDAPLLANAIPDQTTAQDTVFNYQLAADTFNDIDTGATLTYTAQLANGNPLPAWLSFDSATGAFSGTPANADVGTVSIEVTANDGNGGTATDEFAITVNNLNDAPTAANPIPNQTAIEDTAFVYQFDSNTFVDIDTGDTLSYNARLANGNPLPAWLSFDSTTRTFSGTPANGDVGALAVEVTASDTSGEAVTSSFSVTVNNSNDAPTVSNSLPDQIATEGAPFNFQIAANTFTDMDTGDTLSYSARLTDGGPLPSWLNFNATTLSFSGIPTNADVGMLVIEVTVDDGNGGIVADIFTITVANTNSIPTTSGLGDITNNEDAAGDTQDLFTAFDDADSSAAQLIYTVVDNSNPTLISGTTVDTVNGRLQLEYAENQSGSSVIILQATDVGGASVTTSFMVTITPINDNPVTVGNNPLATVVDLATPATNLSVLGAFDDIEDGRNMAYTIVGNSNPAVAQVVAVDSENGLFIISHSGTLSGTTEITVRATDSEGAWVERSVQVYIQGTIVTQPEPSDDIPGNDTESPAETPVSPTAPESPTPSGNGNDDAVQPPPAPPEGSGDTSVSPIIDPLLVNLGPVPEMLPMTDYEYQSEYDDRDRNEPKSEREVDQQMAEPTAKDYQLISLAPPPGGFLNEQDMSDFQDAIDSARESMTEAFEEEQRRQDAIAAVTISFTTGLIIWSLRASSLLLTLFSMLPLWRGIDPLPVLENVKRRKEELEQQRRDKLKEDSSAREVGYLFDQPTLSSAKSRKVS